MVRVDRRATCNDSGSTSELGVGIARFKEVVPAAVETGVEPTPWADRVVGAEHIEYPDGSVANLVPVDVHHLGRRHVFSTRPTELSATVDDSFCSNRTVRRYRPSHMHTFTMKTSTSFRPLVAFSPSAVSSW